MELPRVSVVEAKRRVDEDGWTLVDVRSVAEFDEGHPQGALNVPFLNKTAQGMIPNGDFVATLKGRFADPAAAKLLVIGAMGARSVRATQELRANGFVEACDVKGGFNGERDDDGAVINPGWADAGLPIETGSPAGRSYRDLKPRAPEEDKPVETPRVINLDMDLPEDAEGMNRFASRRRKVLCFKLGRELPGLKRRPYPGPLGERIFNEISAEAWNDWVEHSKMIINEYRINSADPNSLKLLMEQCEAFFYGEGVERPAEYTPQG